MRQNYDRITEIGFQVIAINPDTPTNTALSKERYRLPFDVLGNPSMTASIDFGIAWRVSGKDDEYYEKLRRASGETHLLLPTPSYFVLDTDRRIHFEYVNPNFRIRPSTALMVAAATEVKALLERDDK